MRRPASIADLPQSIGLFPLSKAIILPATHRPLNIFEPRFIALIDDALASHRLVGVIQPSQGDEEAPKGQIPLETVGGIGRIVHFEEQAENRYFVVLEGVCRFKITQERMTDTIFRQADIDTSQYAEDFQLDYMQEHVDRNRLLTALKTYSEFSGYEVEWREVEKSSTRELVNFSSMVTQFGARDKQALLEAQTIVDRAETLIALTEMEIMRSQQGIVLQ